MLIMCVAWFDVCWGGGDDQFEERKKEKCFINHKCTSLSSFSISKQVVNKGGQK